MSAETVAILAPYLAGPGAAVLVLLFVIIGTGFIFVKFIIPMIVTFANRHLEQIDALIKNQQEEANIIAKALSSLDRRLAVIEARIITRDDTAKP
jgi:hypothetical protein